jgi:hypothetical protein
LYLNRNLMEIGMPQVLDFEISDPSWTRWR